MHHQKSSTLSGLLHLQIGFRQQTEQDDCRIAKIAEHSKNNYDTYYV